MDETFDSIVDSVSSSEPSVTVPDSPSVPEPAPVDPTPDSVPSPSPEPSPEPVAPEPVEPVSPSPVGPSPSDSDETVVPPFEDSVVGDDQQPGQELPGWMADYVYGFQPQVTTQLPEELILDNVETFQLSPIEDSTGLKGVLLRIIGPYDNIVTQYRYQQSNNQYYTYVNEVTPDYPWIASAVLFIALLVSLFGLLKRSMSWMK